MHSNRPWKTESAEAAGCQLSPLPDNWPETIADARKVQQKLAASIVRADRFAQLQYVAGADTGFEKVSLPQFSDQHSSNQHPPDLQSTGRQGEIARGVIAVLSWPELQLVDYAIARCPVPFPYIPGYLSFRECPALIAAWRNLSVCPDLVFCDGQGIAHPRRFGIACHFGLLAHVPTIGVGKSRLIGSHDGVAEPRGSSAWLMDKGERVGTVVRTRDSVKPLFVSAGHGISDSRAVELVLQACRGYRLPEPVRWSDGIASRRPAFINKLNAGNIE